METRRYKNWWFLTINGLISVLFGLLLILLTQEFIKTIVFYFGLLILLGGLIFLIAGINNLRKDKAAWMILFESLTSLAIGLIIMIFPQKSLELFLILFGIWAIVIGIIQWVLLLKMKEVFAHKNLMFFNGFLSIALGIALLFNPFSWAVFLVKIIGGLIVVFGILLVYFSVVLHALKIPDQQT